MLTKVACNIQRHCSHSFWWAIWADSLLHRPVWREPTEGETKAVLRRVCSEELAEVCRLNLPWLPQEFGSWWSSQTLWRGRQTSLSPVKWKTSPKISAPADLEIQTIANGLYFGLNAKSAVLHNHWILGELFKQVLPLTGELAKRTFGHKKDSPENKKRRISIHLRISEGTEQIMGWWATWVCSECNILSSYLWWQILWHSPLGDHQDVGFINLCMSKIFVLGVTSVLDFLRKEEKGIFYTGQSDHRPVAPRLQTGETQKFQMMAWT